MMALVRSPPASMTRTSPVAARFRAAWTIRLSPGAVFTVSATPASTPPAWSGRSLAPPCTIRFMESLMFATPMALNFSTVTSPTLRLREWILKPMDMTASVSARGGREFGRQASSDFFRPALSSIASRASW